MSKRALVIVFVPVILAVAGDRLLGQKPVEPCSLLTPAELQTLAGSAKTGNGAASTDPLGSQTCQYKWGTGNNVQSGLSYLTISVADTAKLYPGMNSALLRDGLLARAKTDAANTSVVAAVGDAAIVESNAPIRVTAQALAKGKMVIIGFESVDARAKKDQVVALLKAVVGRL